jgi:hypothetical protein
MISNYIISSDAKRCEAGPNFFPQRLEHFDSNCEPSPTRPEIDAFVSPVERKRFAYEVDGGDSGNHRAGSDDQSMGAELQEP